MLSCWCCAATLRLLLCCSATAVCATTTDEDLDWYLGLTRSRFNGLTPENRFKWPMYEQQPGQYQKAHDTLLKAYIGFAQAANFSLVRGHTLEWGKGRGGFW